MPGLLFAPYVAPEDETGKRRAVKGGEVAPNGEFYKGGQFINTVPENAKNQTTKTAKPRKLEIEPRVWVIAEADQKSIYNDVKSYCRFAGGKLTVDASLFRGGTAYNGETFAIVESLVNRFNDGERLI